MQETPKNLSLNRAAMSLAKQLIQDGKVNKEQDNWEQNKPNPESENAFLAEHEMKEYGRWFLATVDGTDPETKGHYEFPFGNFDQVFRSGLIAAKQRAGQFKHSAIEQAAGILLGMLESGS